jgi:hypothetical protein
MVTVALGEQAIWLFGVEGGMVQVPTRPEDVQVAVWRLPPFVVQKRLTEVESAVESPVYSTHWPAPGRLQISEMAAESHALLELVPPAWTRQSPCSVQSLRMGAG